VWARDLLFRTRPQLDYPSTHRTSTYRAPFTHARDNIEITWNLGHRQSLILRFLGRRSSAPLLNTPVNMDHHNHRRRDRRHDRKQPTILYADQQMNQLEPCLRMATLRTPITRI
jgi:hypothetical protein